MARFHRDTKVVALKQSPLFEGLSRKQLALLARLSDHLDVPAGAVLCREGHVGREFFVIIDGEAEVTRGGRRLATVGPGDFFGEIALPERVNRTATVTAATPLRFFVISDTAFRSVLNMDPSIEPIFCERWPDACYRRLATRPWVRRWSGAWLPRWTSG